MNCLKYRLPIHHLLLACLLLLVGGPALYAQERKVQNKPFIDERRFHYGFFIGAHDQGLQLYNNGYIDPNTGDQWVAQADQQGLGFSVGVLGEWRLSKTLGLRVLPTLHFGTKHIVFRNLATSRRDAQTMKSTYIAVPVDLKVAAPRFNNFRPYVIGGIQPSIDLTAGKHTKVRTKPFNIMLEMGMGCDLYMPFFKFIPELKFCLGLGNILDKKRTDLTDPSQLIYTESLDRATMSMFVLTFYFE